MEESPIQFRVLGSLQVLRAGQILEVPAPKQRALLALLLLRRNEPVSLDEAVDWVWERPPNGARPATQQYMHRLRRIIGADSIRTVAGGYLIPLEPGQLDLERFRELVRAGREQADSGDLVSAAASLRAGLSLWTDGTPLHDVPSHHLHTQITPSLVQERLVAATQAIDVELALGHHHAIVSELTALTGQFPLHEAFWRQLIQALHQAGRPAEALAAYERARRVIANELGVDPGAELQRLYQSLLTGGETEPLPPAPQARPSRAPKWPVFQLPRDTADFVGRTELLTRVKRALSRHERAPSVVVLTGKAGIGKTTLAVRAAHEVDQEFPDGQLYLELRDRTGQPRSVATLLGHVLVALGVPESALPDATEHRAVLYRSLTARRRMLVLLDDADSEEQVCQLLPGGAGCAALVTGRARLTALAGARCYDVEPLSTTTSLELLSAIIGAGRVRASAGAAAELVAISQGVPLAIRIIGARLAAKPHWALGRLLTQLTNGATIFDGLAHGELSLQAAIERSDRRLTPETRAAFRCLSTMTVSCLTIRGAATHLGTSLQDAEDLVEQLVDARLVDPVPGQYDPPRFRFDPFAAAYARSARGVGHVSRFDSAMRRAEAQQEGGFREPPCSPRVAEGY